jgi:hypothetical protein
LLVVELAKQPSQRPETLENTRRKALTRSQKRAEITRRRVPEAVQLSPEMTSCLQGDEWREILEEATKEGGLWYRLTIPVLRKRFLKQNLYQKYFRSGP